MINLFETIITDKAKELVNKTLDSGFLNQGPVVEEFEKQLKEQFWLSNPVTLNSCTSALHLSLILSGVGPGDKVIIPPQTFISTGLAVLMCGAEPIFCDVNEKGNIDTDKIYENDLKKAKALICVHWGGYPCELEKLDEMTARCGVMLIEDAAHALGAHYKMSSIGNCYYSDIACFSLQSIKSLTSGDGGVLCTSSSVWAKKAERLRWFNIDKKNIKRNENGERVFDISSLGYKMHMNDLTASLGLGNLEGLKERINRKYGYAQTYNNRLKGVPGILSLPETKDNKPSYWLYTLLCENRDGLIKKLRENDVMASTVDTRIDKYTIFKDYRRFLPGMDYFEKHQVSIPCLSSMEIDDVIKICELIKGGW